MKKSLSLVVCSALIIGATSVQALEMKKPDMGAIKNATSAVSGAAAALTPTAVRGTIADMNKKLIAADAYVQSSFKALTSALLSKEDAAKIKAELDAINQNKNLSAAEKSAKVAAVMSDTGNTLKEQKNELGEKIKSANNAKKTEISNAVVALAVASYQYLDIANDCRSIAMKISTNPTLAVPLASELTSLKDTGIILKNNVSSLKNVTTQAVAVAKIGGIEIKIPKPTKNKATKVDLNKLKK